jgi:hypothetical protein
MKKALSSSETSIFTRATRRNIPEGAILHSHRRENLKSYGSLVVEEYLTRLGFGFQKGQDYSLCRQDCYGCRTNLPISSDTPSYAVTVQCLVIGTD